VLSAVCCLNDVQDGSGAISMHEMGSAMRALGLDPSEQQLKELFNKAGVYYNKYLVHTL